MQIKKNGETGNTEGGQGKRYGKGQVVIEREEGYISVCLPFSLFNSVYLLLYLCLSLFSKSVFPLPPIEVEDIQRIDLKEMEGN